MLIVCNGAAKSGSTWLYNIVSEIVDCEWPAQRYLTSSKKHPTIRPDKLEEFLDAEDFVGKNVITKTHYGDPQQRELLLGSPHVRVLDLDRDLRDVIVSSYYDACRRHGFTGSFGVFYWFEGRSQAEYLIRYHRLWAQEHPQILVTAFEGLKNDFAAETRRIAAFLGREVTDEEVGRIREATTLDSLRQRYSDDLQYVSNGDSFFRKGEVGDWKNHFDEAMRRDIALIEQTGIGRFDRVELLNMLKRKLYAAVPALSVYRRV